MRILALGLMLAAPHPRRHAPALCPALVRRPPAKVDWLAGLARLPRAYLHDVHEVVSRESLAGGMHALTAGGLLASLALLLLMAWGGWRGILPGLLLLAGLACLIAGSLLVARRRYPQKPRRLSGGRFQVLPFLLLIFPLVAAPIAFAEMGLLPEGPGAVPPGQILTSLLLLALAAQIAGGPLKHVVAGALHLIVHPRPARFGASVPSPIWRRWISRHHGSAPGRSAISPGTGWSASMPASNAAAANPSAPPMRRDSRSIPRR